MLVQSPEAPVTNHILIVGASSGVGESLLRSLIEQGHQVTHLSRSADKVPAVSGARGVVWDAVKEPFPAECLPERLDGLVYCPGSIRLKPFTRLREQELRDDLDLNLLGAVRTLQAVSEPLKRSDRAAVVLFSTVAVGTGMPFHASVAAAKGAVEGLTRSLAAEWAPAIRVNAVAPTITDTPLAGRLLNSDEKRQTAADRHPLKRIATPEDIADAVRWLLTGNSLVTGQVLQLDAGLSELRLL
ncbi:oxidoreductase [Halochromatium glycolicum]|jgi:NAD(P)-dependent dehydrogenase (short-subunit alcohol dehydrogenase family)|uniref:Oxidoreductase n=1 Tax=Halochromatium glycolicum TaxID=85075 RepID=A0AAJ0XAX5_9GAMM|nr:oxidoreductase [Halochromatium glycolicum]